MQAMCLVIFCPTDLTGTEDIRPVKNFVALLGSYGDRYFVSRHSDFTQKMHTNLQGAKVVNFLTLLASHRGTFT